MEFGLILKLFAMTIFFIICSACFDPVVSTCLDFIQKTFFRALNFIMRSLCSLDFCLCVAKAIFSTKAEFAAAVQTLNIKTITSTLLELSFGDIPEKQREHRRKHLVKRSGRLVRKDLQYLNKVLFSLEYLMQMRFPVKRGALVIYPAVPVYGICDRNSMCHQLRRLASFYSCPGVRLPPGTYACRLVNSGYYFHVASQRIICFACGDLYPSHADVCHREHENVTFLQPPSEDPDGVDVAGRMNVQVRPSDSLELREDFRQQLNDASSVNTATAAGAIDDVQETDLEGNAPRDNSGIYGSGLMENQVLRPHEHDVLLHPVMDSDRPLSIMANRMATFTPDWSGPPASVMAECGLYQVSPDRARCFSCKVVFRHLTTDTNIWSRHRDLAPRCRHLDAL